jgi:hypothetical protein
VTPAPWPFPRRFPKIQFDRISPPVGIFADFGVANKREAHNHLPGIMWDGETLTTGESAADNEQGHAIVLGVAVCFGTEPLLGNRVKLIVCGGFSCGHQEDD